MHYIPGIPMPRAGRQLAEDMPYAGAADESEHSATAMRDPHPPDGAPAAEAPQIDVGRQQQARRYARQSHTLALIDWLISTAVILVFLIGGLSFALRDALAPAAAWRPLPHWAPLQLAAYFAVLYGILLVLGLPLSVYGGYTLPHRYGLSTQRLRAWIADQLKGQALTLIFLLAAVEFVYLLLATTPNAWWLWVGGAMLLFTVLLANLAPVLLVPLFYKLTPLPDGVLKERLLALAALTRTRVRGIYTMNLSARTRAANAMVMGLGNTRRILIGDTLLAEFAPDEIEVVVAHELGHQVHHDIFRMVIAQTIITLGGLYLVNLVLHSVVGAVPGYRGLADAATMPLVAAALGVFGLITMPLSNGLSRRAEHRADVYALDTTHDTAAFIGAMTRLANQNLAETDPAPWVEWLLHSHPAVGRRIAFARRYAALAGSRRAAG
jgi:STE24 endopeptidase